MDRMASAIKFKPAIINSITLGIQYCSELDISDELSLSCVIIMIPQRLLMIWNQWACET